MVEIATVAIEVDTNGVPKATSELGKLSKTSKEVTAETKKLTAEEQKKIAAFNQVGASTTRLNQNTAKYRNSVRILDAALKRGRITQTQYNTLLGASIARFNQVERSAKKAAGGILGLSTVTRGGAGGIQNVAFQVGDFATQVGAGTSAAQALGQQLPQLLGGFGALGAVLGAVAAIGIPSFFALLGESGKTLSQEMDDLSDAVERYVESAEKASQPTLDLIGDFGSAAERAQEIQQILAKIDFSSAASGVEAVVSSLSEYFDVQDRVNASEIASFFDLQGLFGFASMTDEARESVFALQQAFIDLKNEDTLEGQISAANKLLNEFFALAEETDGLNEKEREFIQQLGGAILEMERLAAASTEVAPGISDAVNQAERLEAALRRAAAVEFTKAQGLRSRFGNDEDLAFTQGFGVNPSNERAQADRSEAEGGPSRRRGRSGGGGGGSSKAATAAKQAAKELENQAKAVEKLRESFDPLLKAQNDYRDTQELLNSALAAGQITQEQYNATLAQAKMRFQEVVNDANVFTRIVQDLDKFSDLDSNIETAAKSLQSNLSDFLFDPFDEGILGMVRGFSAALAQMAADALSAQIVQGIFGGLGGGGGGGLGDLFAGFFDAGGRIGAGQVGIAGENGPEFVRGPAVVTSTKDTAAMMGGGDMSGVEARLDRLSSELSRMASRPVAVQLNSGQLVSDGLSRREGIAGLAEAQRQRGQQ